MIADVQYLCRRDTQSGAGSVEDAGFGLGRAVFARTQLEGEMMGQADPFRSALPLLSAATGTRAAIRASASIASG